MKYSIVYIRVVVLITLSFYNLPAWAQKTRQPANLVYVDRQGVLRYTAGKQPATFFGVNYTTPFAYAFRAHKALNVDPGEAIRQDVYHFARLGFDAFRVHVWDTEISDSAGNLLQNEHLRLFDFLLAELKKRNIKTIITPIAFWGNGYPERDENTPGFSRVFGRNKLTTNDTAIRAQENYIRQFFNHVNPFTGLSYEADKDIIAVEINNEPSHSGPKAGVTTYINRLAKVLKNTGWSKPVFYNISQSPYYADAVAASAVDGYSFQWYPSGLVGGKTLQGNALPNVDVYRIPYRDTITAFANKALMVYEFDAADVFESYLYPAMAKGFRQAGFQWATQFAYDPLALAHANTEYQTHYLNLAYTPSKAISMLIAGEAFHQLPRLKTYGVYPADSIFDAFRVSYKTSLSEMNSAHKFYYSNTTTTFPKNSNTLQHIAGVGNSPIVEYPGTGAYFLDQLEPGVWRLELMPDAVHIRDPFEKASPAKTVTTIRWRNYMMQINLPGLGKRFSVRGLNKGNKYSAIATNGYFSISPGTYLLLGNDKNFTGSAIVNGSIGLTEFVAPVASKPDVVVRHKPVPTIPEGHPFTVTAIIDCLETATVSLRVGRLGGGRTLNIPMNKTGGYTYTARVPENMVTSGQLNYRIVVQQGEDYTTYPGKVSGNPAAWDSYHFESYNTNVASAGAGIVLYNPTTDQDILLYPAFRQNYLATYSTGDDPSGLELRLSATGMHAGEPMGFQYFIGEKMRWYQPVMNVMDKLVMRASSKATQPVKARITFINKDGMAYSTITTLTREMKDIEIRLEDFIASEYLLLPRAYPGFQPLWYGQQATGHPFILNEMEKIEITTGPYLSPGESNTAYNISIASVKLKSTQRSTSN